MQKIFKSVWKIADKLRIKTDTYVSKPAVQNHVHNVSLSIITEPLMNISLNNTSTTQYLQVPISLNQLDMFLTMNSLSTEPETEIMGGPDLFIYAGSTINLTCIVRHTPEPPNTINWTHRGKVRIHFNYKFSFIMLRT